LFSTIRDEPSLLQAVYLLSGLENVSLKIHIFDTIIQIRSLTTEILSYIQDASLQRHGSARSVNYRRNEEQLRGRLLVGHRQRKCGRVDGRENSIEAIADERR